jgi:gas vesicle protein
MTHGENPQNAEGHSFLIGVLAGATVAVGLGLLFAPRAGSELRGTVWNAVARGAQKVEAYATDGNRAHDREREGPSGRRSSMTVSLGSEDPAL